MKNIIITVITSSLLAFSFISCSDFFEVQPKDFISQDKLFTTSKGANTALAGIYNELMNQNLYGRTLINELDTYSNDLCWGAVASPVGLGGWAYNAADQKMGELWRYLYEGVNRANLFLDNINSVTDLTTAEKQAMAAQAKFLRALFYFNLVQNWGAVPLKLSATTAPEAIHIPVTAADKVFEVIHADLDSAIAHLPKRSDYPAVDQSSRPSKTTAMALQARVYLRQAGEPFNITPQVSYTAAAKYAGDVMASKVHKLNPSFSQVFINLITDKYDNVNNENLMEVEFTYNDVYTNLAGFPSLGAQMKYNGVDIIMAGGAVRTTRKLFNLYETRDSITNTVVKGVPVANHYLLSKDQRRDWTIQDYTLVGSVYGGAKSKFSFVVDATHPLSNATNVYYKRSLNETATIPGRCVGKWRRDYEAAGTLTAYGSPCNFPLIRYSEVLLIFAEADVMAKNQVTKEALDAINEVKKRAAADTLVVPDIRALDVTAFKNELRDERARELFGEGHRRHDLIRWGIFNDTFANLPMDDPTISTWGRSIQGVKYLLLPYPARETSTNNAMRGLQNPGW